MSNKKFLKSLSRAVVILFFIGLSTGSIYASGALKTDAGSPEIGGSLNIRVNVTNEKELIKAAETASSGIFNTLAITIQPKTYILNKTVRIKKSNVRLIFEPGVKFVLADHVNKPVIGIGDWGDPPAKIIRNISISGNGVEIDGNKANQDSEYCAGYPWIRNNGIDVRSVHRLTIENVVVHDARSGGLVISWDSADVHVLNSSFNSNFFDGVAYYDSVRLFTVNCSMITNEAAAISLDSNLKDCIFSGCIGDSNGDVGIFMRNSEQIRFNHCVIKNSGNYAAFLSHDEFDKGVHDIMFSGCHILNNLNGGIYVASTAAFSDYTSVVGCVFRGNSGDAVKSDGSVIYQAANIVQ